MNPPHNRRMLFQSIPLKVSIRSNQKQHQPQKAPVIFPHIPNINSTHINPQPYTSKAKHFAHHPNIQVPNSYARTYFECSVSISEPGCSVNNFASVNNEVPPRKTDAKGGPPTPRPAPTGHGRRCETETRFPELPLKSIIFNWRSTEKISRRSKFRVNYRAKDLKPAGPGDAKRDILRRLFRR